MNTHAFDAVWSVYKAIKDHVAAGGDLSSFEHKNDIGRGIANELFGKLLDLDFYGTSVCCCLRNACFLNYFFVLWNAMFVPQGNVSFNSKGDEELVYEILQVRSGKFVVIGFFDAVNENIKWTTDIKNIFAGI